MIGKEFSRFGREVVVVCSGEGAGGTCRALARDVGGQTCRTHPFFFLSEFVTHLLAMPKTFFLVSGILLCLLIAEKLFLDYRLPDSAARLGSANYSETADNSALSEEQVDPHLGLGSGDSVQVPQRPSARSVNPNDRSAVKPLEHVEETRASLSLAPCLSAIGSIKRSSTARDEPIMVTVTDVGYMNLVPAWMEMCRERGFSDAVVLALDTEAARYLQAAGFGEQCVHNGCTC
jgi:hypothetical protein